MLASIYWEFRLSHLLMEANFIDVKNMHVPSPGLGPGSLEYLSNALTTNRL